MKKNQLERYRSLLQFLKFNVVGVLNTIVDFVVYSIMCIVGLHYMLAQVIGYAFGVGNSYLLNSLWTFSRERKHTADEFGRFLLVNLVSLGVSLGVLWAGHNLFHIQSDFWCKMIATPASLIVNFTGNKLFVFKKDPGQEPAAQTDGEKGAGAANAAGEAPVQAQAQEAQEAKEKTQK
ncbi:MAG: GtrA family protein [Clostridia bacterium]|nr:GtrA family protein [Clostridia bacterium]